MNATIESINAWGARFAGFALPMLLQSAVLITLLFALDLALRKKVRATFRYAVWMLALVKLALPPSLASPTGAAYWLPAATTASYVASSPATVATPAKTFVKTTFSVGGAIPTAAPPALTGQAILFVIWLTVAVGMGIWVVWRLRTVVSVMGQSAEASEAVRTLLESCRQQLGIRRAIPVRCAAIGSPAICGVLRPIILIPPALAEKLGEAEMRPVLLHELAHYKRGDLWVNHAQIFLQIVYWYNPVLWLANASIRRAREQAVDEIVLVEMGGEAQAYPAMLLHVAKLGLGRPLAVIGLMGILEPGRGLTQRIMHIMNRPLPRTARIGARGLAAVLLLALVAVPMACRTKVESEFQPAASATKNMLLLTISKQGTMTLQNEPVTPDNLQEKLTEAYRDNPQPTLAIWCSKKPDWEMTQKMIEAAKAAKVPVVNMVTMEAPPSGEVNDPTAPEPLVTAVTELKHSNLTNIFTGLQPLLSAGSAFIVDAHTHELIIRTTKREMPRVKMFITNLDGHIANDPEAPAFESAQPKAISNEPDNDEVEEMIAFDAIPLPDAIRALARAARLNIQFDPELLKTTPPMITVKWKNVTAKQALIALLDNWGWQLVMDPSSKIGRITTKDPTALEPLVTAVVELKHGNPANIIAELLPVLSTRSSMINDPHTHKLIIRTTERELPGIQALIDVLDSPVDKDAKAPAPQPATSTSAQPIVNTNEPGGDEILQTVVFKDTPLLDAINALARQARLNIQFDPKLLTTVGPDGHAIPITPPGVTENWKDLTAKQGLVALLDKYDWQIVMDPHSPIARVTAKDPAALKPLVTEVYQLEHKNPKKIIAKVMPILSPRSSLITDARTHKLIIRTTEKEMPTVKALIAKLDTDAVNDTKATGPP